MPAFERKGGCPGASGFRAKSKIFLVAASLDGIELLIVLPIYTYHYKLNPKELAATGCSLGTVRTSFGLEDRSDLIQDLKQAPS